MGVKVRQLDDGDYKVKCLNEFYSLSGEGEEKE